MDKAQQILTGVAEAHAAAKTALEITRAAAHVERDHALILVPDIDHTVELVVAGLDRKTGEETFPVRSKRRKRRVKLRIGLVL